MGKDDTCSCSSLDSESSVSNLVIETQETQEATSVETIRMIDACCDCMSGDGGPGSCAGDCRGKSAACQACFSDISTYNKCIRDDTCSCSAGPPSAARRNHTGANNSESDAKNVKLES